MYNGIKSKVKLNEETSPLFYCNLGVHQGENLLPFLLSIYINDNKSIMIDRNIHEFTSITNDLEDDLLDYCKILFLFYADDIVLMKFLYTVKSGNIQ